ncbi:MAG: putative porin [Bacteroidales bacterium]|nr:putative porin [Bacteroidales bacterium]
MTSIYRFSKSISILSRYLAISILIGITAMPAFSQNSKKDKNDKKKDYPMKVSVWQLDEESNTKNYDIGADTILHMFQVYDLNDKKSISVSNLGNMGTPYISNIFDDRENRKKSPVFFMDYLDNFISKPEDTKFYQVNHPYTWLYYCTTPKSRNGQVIDFTHTQNVTKKFNWGFNIGLVGSTGRINHQHTRNTNVTPQMSYIGKHLKLHFFYKFNKSYIEEYGGIDDNVEVRNNRFTTRMSNAFSNWGRRTWTLNGEYSLGKTDFQIINDSTRKEIYVPRIAFNYTFNFDKIFRTYEDGDMSKDIYSHFDQMKIPTYDSLFFHRIHNQFQIKLMESNIMPGLRGAIGAENDLFSNFDGSYILDKGANKTTMNTYIEGGISKNKTKNLVLNGSFRQYLSGMKLGDILVNGNLGFKLFKGQSDTINYMIKASIDFKNEEPTYFEQKYYSNNYSWQNNFEKTQSTRIGGEMDFPRWHAKIGVANYLINKYIYIAEDGKPAQMKSPLSVQSLSLMKDFFVWHVRFANRATLQNANHNDVLNLPKFALYHSTYFEFYLVKNVLLTQIGGEVRYSGEYNAFGYAPATSLYYPAHRLHAGDYPIINGFANIRIRNVLMFFKWEYINDGFVKDWYASVDDYPIQDFHFMFGILWRFND